MGIYERVKIGFPREQYAFAGIFLLNTVFYTVKRGIRCKKTGYILLIALTTLTEYGNEDNGFAECNRVIIMENVSRAHWIGNEGVFIGLTIKWISNSAAYENVLMSMYNMTIYSGRLYQSSTSSEINLTLQVEGENSIDGPNSLVAIGDFNELTIIGSGNLSVSGGVGGAAGGVGMGVDAIIGVLNVTAENVVQNKGTDGQPGQPGLRGTDNG